MTVRCADYDRFMTGMRALLGHGTVIQAAYAGATEVGVARPIEIRGGGGHELPSSRLLVQAYTISGKAQCTRRSPRWQRTAGATHAAGATSWNGRDEWLG